MMPTFVDTNVFVYTFDTDNLAKQAKAQEIVFALTKAGELVVSTQVLQELYVTLRRRFVVRLGDDEIERGLRRISANPLSRSTSRSSSRQSSVSEPPASRSGTRSSSRRP
jgi:predicted nucleic acid-binding protein